MPTHFESKKSSIRMDMVLLRVFVNGCETSKWSYVSNSVINVRPWVEILLDELNEMIWITATFILVAEILTLLTSIQQFRIEVR